MDFGVAYFPTHNAMAPDAVARLVEDRGFDSLFFAEHTHIPASRLSPYGDGSKELPTKYLHTYDLFVALTAAALATTRLRVGSGICLVIERDPIITAKRSPASTSSAVGGSSSASARAGTAKRWKTTAPTRASGWL
ncbi:MAG: luciferase family protein [Frankiales bacterium]|nr:luciferase family protein [Frankiales bacterium]